MDAMVKRDPVRKLVSLAISALLIFLIFFILVPPSTAVLVKPGIPSSTSVNTGTTITFTNVNLTVRGVERIPVDFLNFTIFKSNGNYAAHIKFYINGTEIEDYPSGKFTVTNTTTIGSSWYSYGYQNGTDESTSQNYNFGYGYGYGYGGASGYIDVIFLYDITYTTHTTGTFYAKLLVNSTNHTYASSNSQTITVTSPGGGGGWTPPTEEEEEEETETTDDIINDIEEQYGVTLEVPFYANDTDGDGTIDTFTDPNGVLTSIHRTTVNGNTSFLISVDDDEIPEFFWDTQADTITPITHDVGDIVDTEIDPDTETITLIVSIEKANWTYIEITDPYPDNPDLTVKTSDGRTISSDKIWRKNNKIYVLDDPATEYLFIYSYEPVGFLFDVILELTTDSVFETENIEALITLINVGEPGLVNATINYILYKEEEIIWSEEEDLSILGQLAFNKTISTTGLNLGEYTFKVVHYYGDNQTASAQATFTVKAQPSEEFPLWIIVVILIILIIIIIIAFLIKTGYINIRR